MWANIIRDCCVLRQSMRFSPLGRRECSFAFCTSRRPPSHQRVLYCTLHGESAIPATVTTREHYASKSLTDNGATKLEIHLILDASLQQRGWKSKALRTAQPAFLSRAQKQCQTFPVPGRPVRYPHPSGSLPIVERRPPTLFGPCSSRFSVLWPGWHA